MRNFLTTLFVILTCLTANAQELPHYKSNYLSLSVSYLELKDQINHGFVFRGPDAVIEFGVQKFNDKRYFAYSFSIGGGGKIAIDSWGFRWALSPANISYSFNIYNTKENTFYIGPDFSANYSIQNYPDMHSGWLNWMTNYSLGVHFLGLTNFKGKKIKVQFKNAILSLISRPETERDPYYFSLKVGDIVANTHKNMSLVPANKYFQTELCAELLISRKSSLSYTFQYAGYFDNPKFQQLFHALKYTFYFNKIGW